MDELLLLLPPHPPPWRPASDPSGPAYPHPVMLPWPAMGWSLDLGCRRPPVTMAAAGDKLPVEVVAAVAESPSDGRGRGRAARGGC